VARHRAAACSARASRAHPGWRRDLARRGAVDAGRDDRRGRAGRLRGDPPGIETNTQQPSALGSAWNGLLGTSTNVIASRGGALQFVSALGCCARSDVVAPMATSATRATRDIIIRPIARRGAASLPSPEIPPSRAWPGPPIGGQVARPSARCPQAWSFAPCRTRASIPRRAA